MCLVTINERTNDDRGLDTGQAYTTQGGVTVACGKRGSYR